MDIPVQNIHSVRNIEVQNIPSVRDISVRNIPSWIFQHKIFTQYGYSIIIYIQSGRDIPKKKTNRRWCMGAYARAEAVEACARGLGIADGVSYVEVDDTDQGAPDRVSI